MADISKIELENEVYDIKDSTARSDIATLTQTVGSKISNISSITTDNFKIYLDALNGDDDNDGTTWANAIKTIDTVFTKYGNKGQSNLWLFFGPGEYTLNVQNLNNLSMHWGIKSSTNGNVTVKFNNTMYATDPANVDIAFYQCHLKVVGNYTNNQYFYLKGTSTCRRIYFDSGSLATQDGVIFQDLALAFHCSGYEGFRTTIPELQASCSKIRLETAMTIGYVNGYVSDFTLGQCTVKQTYVYTVGGALWNMFNCNVVVTGSTSVDMQETPSRANFLTMAGGKLTLLAVLAKSGTATYTGNSTIQGGIVIATQARYNGLKALTTSINLTDGTITSSGLSL